MIVDLNTVRKTDVALYVKCFNNIAEIFVIYLTSFEPRAFEIMMACKSTIEELIELGTPKTYRSARHCHLWYSQSILGDIQPTSITMARIVLSWQVQRYINMRDTFHDMLYNCWNVSKTYHESAANISFAKQKSLSLCVKNWKQTLSNNLTY